jgi:outer membrane protein assembly factor BamB
MKTLRFWQLTFAVAMALATLAADWPQFLGPSRDGISPGSASVKTWSSKGPPVLWQRQVGEGYSGPVVSGNRLILFHRLGDSETVDCLNATTGKDLWKLEYPTHYQDQLGKGNGPRATPVISAKHVITLGAGGRLCCLDLEGGTKRWSRSINEEYHVPQNYFGVGSSPLIVTTEGRGLVLVNVGGRDAGIVAFALEDGKEIWKATSDGASYASPILAKVAGTPRAVFFYERGSGYS